MTDTKINHYILYLKHYLLYIYIYIVLYIQCIHFVYIYIYNLKINNW